MSLTLIHESWVNVSLSETSFTFAVEGDWVYFLRVIDVRVEHEPYKVYVKLEVKKVNTQTGEIVTSGELEVEPGQSVTFDNYVIEIPQVYIG